MELILFPEIILLIICVVLFAAEQQNKFMKEYNEKNYDKYRKASKEQSERAVKLIIKEDELSKLLKTTREYEKSLQNFIQKFPHL
jgi:Mg2+ and Co2+ transporter CorA